MVRVKSIALGLGIIASPAFPATIELKVPSLLGNIWCGGVHQDIWATAFEPDGVKGVAYATTTCSAGGRGTKPRTYKKWADVTWDLSGNLTSVVSSIGGIPTVTTPVDNGAGYSFDNLIINDTYRSLTTRVQAVLTTP